jgi:hypothetical protein
MEYGSGSYPMADKSAGSFIRELVTTEPRVGKFLLLKNYRLLEIIYITSNNYFQDKENRAVFQFI